jgi:acetylxylan esterase
MARVSIQRTMTSPKFVSLRPFTSAMSLFGGVLSSLVMFAPSAHAVSFSGSPVPKQEWTTSEVPNYIDMYIALPDEMPAKPPIFVNIHSCANNAVGQWNYSGFAPFKEAMDRVGFIMILPQQSRNCWNVGKPESLTHGGGGDTGAIVQMVQYALTKYNGDPDRVYVMGASGGGMCTQALLAVYPEVFKAGHARAGVPAGCWAEGYDDSQQWAGACANGNVNKTPQQWGDLVRQMNPGFTGPRPRLQLNHGNADEIIHFNNFTEAIEQWTNVLGLDSTPTSTDAGFRGTATPTTGSEVTYNRKFWKDECGFTVLEAWEALNQEHGMGYEPEAILEWFGLDEKRDRDPWDEACGTPGETSDETTEPNASTGEGTSGEATEAPTTAPSTPTVDTTPRAEPTVNPGPVPTPTTTGPEGPTAPAPQQPTTPVTPSGPTGAPVGPTATPSTTDPGTEPAPTTSTDSSSSDGGCGCYVGRKRGNPGVALTLLGVGLLLLRRRRG